MTTATTGAAMTRSRTTSRACNYFRNSRRSAKIFAYNNAAVNLAGRLIEVVTGKPYEAAMQELVVGPLGLTRSGFFTDALVGYSLTASHIMEKGVPVVKPVSWSFPRSLDSTGGLISTARDQMRVRALPPRRREGRRRQTAADRAVIGSDASNPGPGGTITIEVDGVCVSWWQRRTAAGVPVFQHGGSWGGQNSDFFFVPQRGFAMTTLTNSTSGPKLIDELGRSGWALSRFVGLSNPPAVPRSLTLAQLAAYDGKYKSPTIPPDGAPDKIEDLTIDIGAKDGGLRVTGDLELTSPFTATTTS